MIFHSSYSEGKTGGEASPSLREAARPSGESLSDSMYCRYNNPKRRRKATILAKLSAMPGTVPRDRPPVAVASASRIAAKNFHRQQFKVNCYWTSPIRYGKTQEQQIVVDLMAAAAFLLTRLFYAAGELDGGYNPRRWFG